MFIYIIDYSPDYISLTVWLIFYEKIVKNAHDHFGDQGGAFKLFVLYDQQVQDI